MDNNNNSVNRSPTQHCLEVVLQDLEEQEVLKASVVALEANLRILRLRCSEELSLKAEAHYLVVSKRLLACLAVNLSSKRKDLDL